MTNARAAQEVELIPIDKINILNPRVRNPVVFKEIVDNIEKVGLKRPITVSDRPQNGEQYYDLVCGQGRLEAYRSLGQKTVPALVVSADPEDCLVSSLVENCARRQHSALDLLQDISGMLQRGSTKAQIAQKTGLSRDYINGVTHLLDNGEHRLIQSVERGIIPITVAVEIASSDDHDIQKALAAAYEDGSLKGKKLLAAKRLVELRRRRGKGSTKPRQNYSKKMTADALVKAYQEDTERKKAMIQKTEITRSRLVFITEALRQLILDERFLALAEDEGLSTLPEAIALGLKQTSASSA